MITPVVDNGIGHQGLCRLFFREDPHQQNFGTGSARNPIPTDLSAFGVHWYILAVGTGGGLVSGLLAVHM